MMVPTALLFSRYRAFQEDERLELAPLTIIIGKNGGGKSVITRLPLLLASGLSSSADGPLDLTAGGINHASRFEDLIYQRSAHPFSLGAEISDGEQTFRFKATLRHLVEHHSLALEAFDLFENDQPVIRLRVENPEDIGKLDGNFLIRVGNDAVKLSGRAELVGLFPASVDIAGGISGRLSRARGLFEKAFAQPSYLGPFRTELGFLSRIPRQGVKDLGPRGERALDILGDDALRGSGILVRSVEDWSEAAMDGNRVKLEMAGDIPRMIVHDPIRDVFVDIMETGAGFAQIFPVVVQAFARRSGCLTSPFVIVEQPELHLHPAAHGGVADLIIDTVLECHETTRYLCETHSEQIVTRLRRRVVEGKISPDKIQIVSVGHQSALDAKIEPLRKISLDEDGNPDAWPAGVFDEAFDDLVHLREAVRRKDAREAEPSP